MPRTCARPTRPNWCPRIWRSTRSWSWPRAATRVHPGYGFLSENPAFARACEDMGVVFIGPSADAIELMGDKVRAKAAAEAAGVPVVPTYTPETAEYPVLVKAAAGGGGRGMRVVERPQDLEAAMAAASREAAAGFGDDRVFLERYLPRARHIEVQVIGDTRGNVLSFGERECSLQRRHQKVLEESPSPVVSPELREILGREATSLARRCGLRGRGHGRVHRRRRRSHPALLPGDERAAAGRAPGHRARHGLRPGRAAAAGRRRGGRSTSR